MTFRRNLGPQAFPELVLMDRLGREHEAGPARGMAHSATIVSYEGLQRIETFMAPKEVFREVVLNAINHKVYETGNPIQIKVYEDRISVFNQGFWPEDIEVEDLYTKKHSSYPHNPNIAKTFFNSGEIEAYGSGFSKIQIACDENQVPYPEVTITPNGVTVVIKASELYLKLLKYGRYWKTYPEYKEKSVSVLTDEHGDFITDQDGIPLAIEETSEIAPGVLASIDRMMEILSKSLSESEKELYLPIVEYLKTHETIKNADGVKLTGKSAPTVNRYFARLIELDILIPEGENKGRIYRRKPA